MNSIESSAKTTEEAIALGLEKLGASYADVQIDIISEGSKGFLGFGSKPVVVKLTKKEEDNASAEVLSAVSLSDAIAGKKPRTQTRQTAQKPEKEARPAAAEAPAKKPETRAAAASVAKDEAAQETAPAE